MRNNLLWIFVDQLRYHALSRHGELNAQTPNLDRLASEGVDFHNAITPVPVCTPARGCVITGRYPRSSNVYYLGDLLAPSERTVAHAFRDHGYRTSYVGKWHLASAQNPIGHNEGAEYWVHPLLRGGFEDWFGFELSNHFWRTRYSTDDRMWPPHELKGYQTDALVDLSIDYLDRVSRSDQPWFHVLSLESPHHGSDENNVASVTVGDYSHTRHPAPSEYERRFDKRTVKLRPNVPAGFEEVARSQQAEYCAMVENLDDNVGRLLDHLESRELLESTAIAFFSDHGEMGGSHRRFQKGTPHAESLGVPLIIRAPGVDAGQSVQASASLVDLFPTCADLCGVPIPEEVHGSSFAPLITGSGPAPQRAGAIALWYGNPRYAKDGVGGPQWRCIRTERYTYAIKEEGHEWLVDNTTDPYQLENLASEPAAGELRRTLRASLVGELRASGEEIPAWL